jgi:hypothetical protein
LHNADGGKASKQQCNEKYWNCFFLWNQWIHGFFLSFPRYIDSAIAGLEEVGRTWRGKFLRLLQIRFSDAEFGKIALAGQDNLPQA